ncbi:MAG: ImmA/IrrE family metallo-endopeptidase [Propionibacteriaceae bacterium]|jgi:Zn-dependent peptidase ImmA (M78 family)/transcriptional regulator with XRE-family HTH domain|nr:ImmA/IrrE family metallo-endopeptidase [Propionibacteriaceae bacterium]
MSTSVIAPITPAVLIWARRQAAVTVPELAKKAAVKPERVLEWEAGSASPTLAQLRAASDILKQPMALFFTPSPLADVMTAPPDFRGAGATAGRRLTREIRLAEERRDTFKRLAPRLAAASVWPRWAAATDLTPARARARLGVTTGAVAAAKTPHEALRLWIAAVERQGVLVFQMSRVDDGECSGFCLDDTTTPVIALNGKEAPQRRAFTLLHELGHLIGHSGGLCLLREEVDRERACNRFAENVLLPGPETLAAVGGNAGAAAVDVVARDFKVSRVAAAVALGRRGLVGQQVVEDEARRSAEARERAQNDKERSGFAPPARLARRNLGDVYLTTVLDAMDADAISVADATYFLGAKVGLIGQLERELAGSRP